MPFNPALQMTRNYNDSLNAMMVVAALLATITFAGMLTPPRESLEQGQSIGKTKAFFWCSSLGFGFSICALMLAYAIVDLDPQDPDDSSRLDGKTFGTSYWFADLALSLATLCTFGAFVAGIYITFGFLDTDVFVATLVMAIPVGCTVLYNLFGPLCSYTPIKNAWKYVYEGGLCESG